MTEKRKKKDKNISIEELYRNKNFVPPKEKNLETIFEEPRKSKDGAPILTSVKKFKRYLHFDTTIGKLQKRKLKAKKCAKKTKLGNLKTRSSTKVVECPDISLYISEVLGESSDSASDAEIDLKNSDQCDASSGALKRKLRDSDIKESESCRTVYKKPCRSTSEESESSQTLNKDSQISVSEESGKPKCTLDSSIPKESVSLSETKQTIEKEICVSPESDVRGIEDEQDTSRSSCIIM